MNTLEVRLKECAEVQQIATGWLWFYENLRSRMGSGGRTPDQKLKRGPLESKTRHRKNGTITL